MVFPRVQCSNWGFIFHFPTFSRLLSSLHDITTIKTKRPPPPLRADRLRIKGGSLKPQILANSGLWPKNPKIGACGAKFHENGPFCRRFPFINRISGGPNCQFFRPAAGQKYTSHFEISARRRRENFEVWTPKVVIPKGGKPAAGAKNWRFGEPKMPILQGESAKWGSNFLLLHPRKPPPLCFAGFRLEGGVSWHEITWCMWASFHDTGTVFDTLSDY